MEASAQYSSYASLVGTLLGTGHHCVLNYRDFLNRLDEMESRLRWELDSTHGQRLGPPLMVLHTHIIWRSWFVKKLATGQTRLIVAPYFCHGLDILDMHNNLSSLPVVSNVPVIQSLANTGRLTGRGGGHQGGTGTETSQYETLPQPLVIPHQQLPPRQVACATKAAQYGTRSAMPCLLGTHHSRSTFKLTGYIRPSR
jgi:hypothetical protein